MPIYEYECSHCHKNFDLIQKISDPPITQCPGCHQERVQRLISPAGFRLKGSGWYVSDFKDKKEKTDKKDNKAVDSKPMSAEKPKEQASVKTDAKTVEKKNKE